MLRGEGGNVSTTNRGRTVASDPLAFTARAFSGFLDLTAVQYLQCSPVQFPFGHGGVAVEVLIYASAAVLKYLMRVLCSTGIAGGVSYLPEVTGHRPAGEATRSQRFCVCCVCCGSQRCKLPYSKGRISFGSSAGTNLSWLEKAKNLPDLLCLRSSIGAKNIDPIARRQGSPVKYESGKAFLLLVLTGAGVSGFAPYPWCRPLLFLQSQRRVWKRLRLE